MTNIKSPGVYINEMSASPSSATAVETSIPVFIGYTLQAGKATQPLIHVPTRITSLREYEEIFGGSFITQFDIVPANASSEGAFLLEKEAFTVSYQAHQVFYMHNSIRLFYANGGGACYILSIGLYGDDPEKKVKLSDFEGPADFPKQQPLTILENTFCSLILMPDLMVLGSAGYSFYSTVLAHCAKMGDRFAIFDLEDLKNAEDPLNVLETFRKLQVNERPSFGAAYYPWLHTMIIQPGELTFDNLPAMLNIFLEPEAGECIKAYNVKLGDLKNKDAIAADQAKLKKQHHENLLSTSGHYNTILEHVLRLASRLPPAGAIAGVYNFVDSSRGVWKAPANISLAQVVGPVVELANEVLQDFNTGGVSGRSVNVIRSFPGVGPLIWGARTLDGKSEDWKYINVRRTLIMIEQSVLVATRAYVFEPNNAGTWVTVKAMISNFLVNIWKQGGLAGSTPEDVFDVQIGLGSTMTPNDILEGKMLVTIKVALIRPAEFIVLTFQQQMQQS